MLQKAPTMKLKTVDIDGKTYAEVQDGKPVYDDNGKETPFDIAGVTALRGEAMRHRTEKEDAQKALKAFEGLDPEAARKAIDTVGKLDAKKLIDAGEVDRVRNEISASFQSKLDAAEKRATDLEGNLYAEKIGGAFARSPLIVGDKAKLAIPADLVQSHFGKNFKIENGIPVAYDANGNRIYSKANPAVLASFDEALEQIVDAYPHKESILKGTGAQGSGARNDAKGGGGTKTISRTEWDGLSQSDRTSKAKDGFTVVD